jgi:outer membrane lipoprotein SlyB
MKTKHVKKYFCSLLFLTLILTIASCASHSRPQLYPNEVLKEKGQEKAKVDVDQCLKDAEDYFNTPEGKKAAKGSVGYGTAIGTSVGFGMGSGGVGVGVGVGGGERGTSPTDVRKAFVNQCLVNKGYQVLSWD